VKGVELSSLSSSYDVVDRHWVRDWVNKYKQFVALFFGAKSVIILTYPVYTYPVYKT